MQLLDLLISPGAIYIKDSQSSKVGKKIQVGFLEYVTKETIVMVENPYRLAVKNEWHADSGSNIPL
ncbi:MAG: hypothetical protein A4E57_04875 [Syntrophorhabdaceae bacterium PtaU1.Bin034]|nr:MAG: hypothetical protein A4E57_04875 [Syntrophorhabdaceae bacterium PtaU1.Bin034]